MESVRLLYQVVGRRMGGGHCFLTSSLSGWRQEARLDHTYYARSESEHWLAKDSLLIAFQYASSGVILPWSISFWRA